MIDAALAIGTAYVMVSVAARCQANDCPVTPACVEMVERYLFEERQVLDLARYRIVPGDHDADVAVPTRAGASDIGTPHAGTLTPLDNRERG